MSQVVVIFGRSGGEMFQQQAWNCISKQPEISARWGKSWRVLRWHAKQLCRAVLWKLVLCGLTLTSSCYPISHCFCSKDMHDLTITEHTAPVTSNLSRPHLAQSAFQVATYVYFIYVYIHNYTHTYILYTYILFLPALCCFALLLHLMQRWTSFFEWFWQTRERKPVCTLCGELVSIYLPSPNEREKESTSLEKLRRGCQWTVIEWAKKRKWVEASKIDIWLYMEMREGSAEKWAHFGFGCSGLFCVGD